MCPLEKPLGGRTGPPESRGDTGRGQGWDEGRGPASGLGLDWVGSPAAQMPQPPAMEGGGRGRSMLQARSEGGLCLGSEKQLEIIF